MLPIVLFVVSALAAEGLWPLPSMDRSTPDAALAPFAGIIGDATFVGLGESLHCGGGYLEAKARLVRWLVEEHGFRLVAIESPWVRARAATAYVVEGEGTARQAMDAFYLAFHDRETEAMLAWLAGWNAAHPDDPVHFVGFDVQDHVDRLLGVLAEGGASEAEIAACRAGPCEVATDDPWVRLAVDTLHARHALDRANGSLLPKGLRLRAGSVVRDRAMADTLLAIRALVAPEARTVVWAHNRHIARGGSALGWKDMGEHLAERLGADWISVGLVARELETRCQGSPTHAGPRDVERAISEAAGAPAAVVDLRDAAWLAGEWSLAGSRVVPAQQYDALLFFERARAADNGRWDGTPGETADHVRYVGYTAVLTHRGPVETVERERLWSAYAGWLAARGFVPDGGRRRVFGSPATWQRFRSGRLVATLRVRPADGAWQVEVWPSLPR